MLRHDVTNFSEPVVVFRNKELAKIAFSRKCTGG